MRIVVLGLSITSSWGNGHATNYRGLQRALTERGHRVLFLERDVHWYAAHRDLPDPPWGRTELYGDLTALKERFRGDIEAADAVIVGSYVPDGIEVGRWVTQTARGVTVFNDIDTPVTLAALERGDCTYLDRELVASYDVYLSFTGGPTLARIENDYGSPRAVAFHCLVDASTYEPQDVPVRWDLGYLGTYSDDRQPALDRLLLEPARRRPDLRFVVAGPQYPDGIDWPPNVERIDHLPPAEHPAFYSAQRLTLNVTRADMVAAGWSPSVRLFEAAACAVPVVSDRWDGIETFFKPDSEIFLADDGADVVALLDRVDDGRRREVGDSARARVLAEHTAEHRAEQLEAILHETRRRRGVASNLQSRGSADADIAALGPWFHNLHLPDGRQTAPDHTLGDFPAFKWEQVAAALPHDLSGRRALDIGCNAGFYTFALARRGARVVGIDHDPHYLRQAEWAAEQYDLASQVEFRQLGVYDLARLDDSFDLVLFMGVLYHLRYPLLALDLVAEKVAGTLVFQTLTMPGDDIADTPPDLSLEDRDRLLEPGWPTMAFVEKRMADDPTNWWLANAAACEAMLRSAGLRVVDRPGHEMWVCERETESQHRDELDAATGRRHVG